MVSDRNTPRLVGSERVLSAKVIRGIAGLGLFFHAYFHAFAGMETTQPLQPDWSLWLWTTVWTLATICLLSVAYGLWGWSWFARRWRTLAATGGIASALLLIAGRHWWAWIGLLVDVLVVNYALTTRTLSWQSQNAKPKHPIGAALVRLIGATILAYSGLAVALHPWSQTWGANAEDLAKVYPSDASAVQRTHFIDHVIAIEAPPEEIWPYLMQIGQDKAGFYSYDWLERAFGDDVHNIYEIRPEWQNLKEGDVVRLTQANYLGGLLPEGVALKVLRLEPNRLFHLENWGTFWIESLPDGSSRLGVRSSVGEIPFWAAPIEIFGFQPAHFIMEQRMLRTIKELAER